MEAIKFRGLWSSFVLYVITTLVFVTVLSGLTIWGCVALQTTLLPDSNLVYLTIQRSDADGNETTITVPMPLNDMLKEIPSMISMEGTEGDLLSGEQNVKYSVAKIENSFTVLSPKRQLLYKASQIGMVALPVFFSLTGILLCGLLFYRKKLKTPILLLSSATEQIADHNLDFQISYPSADEMGALCDSFEQMRQILKENNQKLWDMLEERRRLQGSVAHDLRNPIAIIQGYAQYLQLSLSGDKISREKISSVAANILQTSHRLERYTDSLRTISRLEELEAQIQAEDFSSLSSNMQKDMSLLTKERNLKLDWENTVTRKELNLDAKILYRILENLIGNAVRFANQKIKVQFAYHQGLLTVTVSDDGPGFPQKVLSNTDSYAYMGDNDENHLGMGLSICRVLCQKHGGKLILSNAKQDGAVVKFILSS